MNENGFYVVKISVSFIDINKERIVSQNYRIWIIITLDEMFSSYSKLMLNDLCDSYWSSENCHLTETI